MPHGELHIAKALQFFGLLFVNTLPFTEVGPMLFNKLQLMLRAGTLAAGLALGPQFVIAQPAPQQPEGAQAFVFPQEELDQLLAPIALYPDTLLMQVLAASTYPLEAVAGQRFVAANPNLKGEALTREASSRGWDSSIISLLQFPSVLLMMSDKLEWTQKLGDAFLAQQSGVMDTVQALRARAQQAGNLQSSEQQNVVIQEKIIVIEPAQPQVVFVPYYNPTVIYGPWFRPAYPPWYWAPPPMYRPRGYGDVVAAGIFWGIAIGIGHAIWSDYRPSWRDHDIHVHNDITINVNFNGNRPRPPGQGTWRHDPVHRKGVAYRDDTVRERVTGSKLPARLPSATALPARLPGRGDDTQLKPRPSVLPAAVPTAGSATAGTQRPTSNMRPMPAVQRPAPVAAQPQARPQMNTHPMAPGLSREAVQQHADRGRMSRESMAKPAAPRPAPRPSAQPTAKPAPKPAPKPVPRAPAVSRAPA